METRRAPRINLNLIIRSKIPPEYKQKFALISGMNFEVEAVDISVLGVGMFSKYFLPVGLILELEITGKPFGLTDNMTVKVQVRHCRFIKGRGYRCGVQFLDLPKEYKKALEEFVSVYERRKAPRLKLAE